MLLTYIITALSGLFFIFSVLYFVKNKRFIGRRMFTTVAAILVFIMGIIAIIKGIPIQQMQALIENMAR